MLGGVNAIVQAEYGVAIGLCVMGGATSYGAASPGDVLHHDGLRRKVFFANGLLENAYKGVAATTRREGHDHGDRLVREIRSFGDERQAEQDAAEKGPHEVAQKRPHRECVGPSQGFLAESGHQFDSARDAFKIIVFSNKNPIHQ